MDLSQIENEILDDRVKGMPGNVSPFPLGRIADQGWNVLNEDLPLPLLVLKATALEHNIDLMGGYCEARGVLLAPHGKTTMAPQLFRKQLEAGAWAMTAASVEQLQVYRRFGVQRVLFANQLVGRANLRYLIEELKKDNEFEFFCFVDSLDGAKLLADAATELSLPSPIQVLAEVGYGGGRGGVRSIELLDELCESLGQSKGKVALAGVAGFEGLLPVQRFAVSSESSASTSVDSFLESVALSVEHLRQSGALGDDFLVTAGGSAAFDKVVEILQPTIGDSGRLVLRSGCYITHDHGMYAETSPLSESLRAALELWSYVQSCPEPGLSLLTFGRRDVPEDHGLPVPLRLVSVGGASRNAPSEWEIESLNDQHAHLRHPADAEIRVGDRVVCGISHPCTAFDKWRVIPVIDDEYNVVDAIRTFF